jgi:EAL domain-containing protein (putative c-di-GMP-specific phosphodiesterase class I)
MTPMDGPAQRVSFDTATALIPRVLKERAIFPVYQPIIDLATREVVGVEALARGPAGSTVESPGALFDAAARAGLLPQVDQLCFTRAVEIALELGDAAPPLLFINAEPAVVDRPVSPELLAAVTAERRFRIVMEYTERELGTHPAALLRLASLANRHGNAIALDDVGTHPMSLAFLPLLDPDVVKLDAHLVRDPQALATRETAAGVNDYAARTGAIVLAEGIETAEDLATARDLGARWGQGWLFGRPGPLAAIANLSASRTAQLRAPHPETYLLTGTPFTAVASREPSHAGDERTVGALIDSLLSDVEAASARCVVVGAYPDRKTGQEWLRRLAAVADAAAFVGIVGPYLGYPADSPVRVVTSEATGAGRDEAVLAFVGSHGSAAVCLRPGARGDIEYTLTRQDELAYAVERMVMSRMETVAGVPAVP